MDTMLSIAQVEDFFQLLTLQMLKLDPDDPANQGRVRIGWPQNGAPGWKIDEDVAFLLITLDDDPITQQVEAVYRPSDPDNADRAECYMRVYRVSWTCYGPNSSADMESIRSGLYAPDIKGRLALSNLAFVMNSIMPIRAPELFNGQWWERTSYYSKFNELVTKHTDVPYLVSADVQILKG